MQNYLIWLEVAKSKRKKKSEERGEKEMVGVGVGFEGDVYKEGKKAEKASREEEKKGSKAGRK